MHVVGVRFPRNMAASLVAIAAVVAIVILVELSKALAACKLTAGRIHAGAAAAKTLISGPDAVTKDTAVDEAEAAREGLVVDIIHNRDGGLAVSWKVTQLAPVAVVTLVSVFLHGSG